MLYEVDFVTDFVCPYCIVAREALDQAEQELQLPAGSVKVNVHPLELTPPEREQVDTWNDPVRRAHYQELDVALGQLGMRDVHFPPHVVPRPRTRLAWEAWMMAKELGRDGAWAACMYRAYFVHQEDIGDPQLLLRYAQALGLDAAALQAAWDEGRYTAALLQLEKEARLRFEPKGVPTIFVNGRRLALTDYTRDEMVQQLTMELQGEGGFCCGPEGC